MMDQVLKSVLNAYGKILKNWDQQIHDINECMKLMNIIKLNVKMSNIIGLANQLFSHNTKVIHCSDAEMKPWALEFYTFVILKTK